MTEATAPQPVIVATPLGESSDGFVAAGLALARALGRPALLLHAEIPPPLLLGAPGGGFVPDAALLDRQRAELGQALDEQAARVGAGPEVARWLRLGTADLVLATVADEVDSPLVVVGPPRRPELGTTADRLLRRTARPVLVVRKPERLPPRRAVVAVDLSPPAERALATGVRLLQRLAGGPPTVELLFALHPQELAASLHFSPERIRAFAAEELRRLARRTIPECSESVDLCVRTGDARDVILDEADRREADLVVLGTHGRTGLERWLLGSVAAGVLRRATTNLLVVPRRDTESAGETEASARP